MSSLKQQNAFKSFSEVQASKLGMETFSKLACTHSTRVCRHSTSHSSPIPHEMLSCLHSIPPHSLNSLARSIDRSHSLSLSLSLSRSLSIDIHIRFVSLHSRPQHPTRTPSSLFCFCFKCRGEIAECNMLSVAWHIPHSTSIPGGDTCRCCLTRTNLRAIRPT